ncbi:MAG: ABC transporter substrate-binding protein [Alcaligenaceae bacterium]|nr:ABC transporter substrate-binding protein [Alcaligenaceae bacterium]
MHTPLALSDFSRHARRWAGGALLLAALLVSLPALAQKPVDPTAAPNDFVQAVADNALQAVKNDEAVKSGDLKRINELVDELILPYVNFEKTTRLSAGRHWRQASPEQQQALVDAFRGTLIRTYSGALANVDDVSRIDIQPFRGDASADDVVVRSLITQQNGPAVGVDYRLEKNPDGWKVYDINVENIWLIQNYRNQFAQQIQQSGIDGLIAALNKNNLR